jgi:predicted ester cyclase
VSLFRRKKEKEGEVPLIVQLYRDQEQEPLVKNEGIVESHLHTLHKPGGVEEEKKNHDFIDFAMSRAYLDALDDIEFTIEEQLSSGDQVTSRWTIRGIHRRPLLGVEPSGEPVEIAGITVSVVKFERVRQEWAFWEPPRLREKLLGRPASPVQQS